MIRSRRVLYHRQGRTRRVLWIVSAILFSPLLLQQVDGIQAH